MTYWEQRIEEHVARAMELDDNLPDEVCPGCRQEIAGWDRYPRHWKPGRTLQATAMWRRRSRIDLPMPFTGDLVNVDGLCEWTLDYLMARRFRRRYIRRHFKAAS